ncbi:MAG: ABC transporter substrate-binding protein, partial [Petrotogales bacterium]
MRRTFILAILALVLIVGMTFGQTFERNETLFAGGGLWGPPTNWNPITPWNAMTGVVGLVYETLYMYDPLTNEMNPWLAVNSEWLDENTYLIELREGIKWTDGEDFNADDVKFTYDIANKYPGVHYSTLWEWLKEVEKVDDYTLKFHFEEPLYHEWSNNLYQLPMIPEHIWSKKTEEEILSGANENPTGTGAYLTDSHGQDRQVFVRNEDWWATEQLGLKPAPKRIVYIAVFNNSVALGMILKGELDISNFFLPGVPRLVQTYQSIHTYYDEPPYMLSDNTAFLFVNNTKKPMDDPEFRKALAFAINSDDIANRVFENQVLTSNPLGYLPIDAWMQYYDEEVVKKYGFSYDPPEARRILAKAGYKDVDGDDYLEAPDGSEIKVSIIVPFGWTDWMESIKIIARNFRNIGIDAEAEFPDYGRYQDELYGGDFDMAINNFNSNLSNTVWT